MPSNLGTYFGILHGLHNIIVIITLNVYFIVNKSEKTQPINYYLIFQRSPFYRHITWISVLYAFAYYIALYSPITWIRV